MRLLNVKSRKLSYFNEDDVPPYVILSHTWGDEEVSYHDISGSKPCLDLKGYQKIDGCCRQALADGYEYVWIDTCCIDKTSSAELSEAINSMFRWYGNADVCYAFLFDVNTQDIRSLEIQQAGSKWFTRGWTLQELIAPREVVFYDSQWVEIGTKLSLCNRLSHITGIDARILRGDLRYEDGVDCDEYSVACRMSWASKRLTTRIEDMAYCLMGIFRVNMPLLYGEGGKAFRRLQEEIMKNSDDHSLFAWMSKDINCDGLLAPSPREFSESGNIERLSDESMSPPFSITNKGVQLTLPLLKGTPVSLIHTEIISPSPTRTPVNIFQVGRNPALGFFPTNYQVVILSCKLSDAPGQRLGLVLYRPRGSQLYLRHHLFGHLVSPVNFSILENTEMETILIRPSSSPLPPLPLMECRCTVRSLPAGFHVHGKYPRDLWNYNGSDLQLTMSLDRLGAVLLFQGHHGNAFAVVFLQRGRSFNIGVTSYLENEDKDQIIRRCHENLEPQDRVIHKLNENMEVLASIKKCPGGRVAHISIRSNLSEVDILPA